MKFRKKPVVIEARQLTYEAFDDVYQWIEKNGGSVEQWEWDSDESSMPKPENWMMIKTLEGDHKAQLNDWVIKGIAGEFYPCNPDIFAMTYEEVK